MSTSVKACPSRTSFSSRGTQKHSLQESPLSTTPNLHWIAGYIWGIADDVLRDVYVRGKYRDVILPMTVLRRLDAVLEPTQKDVLGRKAALDAIGLANQKTSLEHASGQAFYKGIIYMSAQMRLRRCSDFVS